MGQGLRSEPIGIDCRELANKGEDGHVRQPTCCAAKLGAPTQPRIQRMEPVERVSTVWGRIAAIAFGIFSTGGLSLAWPVVDRKSVAQGKSVSVGVGLGGRGIIKKNNIE